MAENENLVTDSGDSLSSDEGNVNNQDLNSIDLDSSMDAFASYLAQEGHIDEAPVAEEPTEEPEVEEPEVEEELVEDAADDSDIEADESAEEDGEDPEVNSEAEIDVLSYNDLFDQVGAVEINGETYTPAQLKSILGQDKAAGTKAREAAERLKELETREGKLIEQEEWLQQRTGAKQQSDQLVQLQNHAKQINAEINKAREEGDMYELSVQKDKLEQLSNHYNKIKREVDQVNQKQEAELYLKAEAGLRELGLNYLLEDSPESKAWTDYISKSLTQSEMKAVTLNPQLAAMVEKARKWDIANSKQGKKLVSKSTTLKTNGNKSSPKKQNAKKMERINSGEASRDELQAYIMQQGRDMFK